MTETARRILDDLMGKDRDLLPSEKKVKEYDFDDEKYCRYYLCSGFCPYQLFEKTKFDVGVCNCEHDPSALAAFGALKESERRKYRFEEDLCSKIESILRDLDRKIRNKAIDKHEDSECTMLSAQISEIDAALPGIIAEAERLGEEGMVTEAKEAFEKAKEQEARKDQLLTQLKSIDASKRYTVCDICGGHLVVGDTDKRLAMHMEGRQHKSFSKIRAWLEEYNRRNKFVTSRDERNREDERDRDRRRDRDDDRRDRDRDRRDRDRDDKRSSHHSHARSRSRSRSRSPSKRKDDRSDSRSSHRHHHHHHKH